jgi:predicted TIM-barrel fold metal-dependent hydrolase
MGAMQVVDPHIHLWNVQTHHYPWMASAGRNFMGPCDPILSTYELREFLADAEGVDVLKVVHIDAAHDPAQPLAETRWLQSLADAPGSRGMPNGIVAYADLSAPDVDTLLALHASHAHVRGIRQTLNVHADPYYDYVGRHFMREPAWRRGFALLARHRLSFDLQIYPSQMGEAVELAAAHPQTPIILNHTGMFVDRSSVEGWRTWRDGLHALARCPNVHIKVSGLGMIDHHWTLESLRPYVLEAIDAFGTERAMFASNFPVDRLYSSYAALWQAFDRIVGGATPGERHALFRGNAERIYRI